MLVEYIRGDTVASEWYLSHSLTRTIDQNLEESVPRVGPVVQW